MDNWGFISVAAGAAVASFLVLLFYSMVFRVFGEIVMWVRSKIITKEKSEK